ncbi:pheromone A receptor-domain-containing protein [Mycena leptocephala]|nr:pheromone A receptor-domain-containing protein [Mycena leptocephala]
MTYFYTGAPNWVFSMFAFVGFLCSTIPLPWHLEGASTSIPGTPGTYLYMIWTALACLTLFINSIVWSGNMIDWSPTCDTLYERLQRRHPRIASVRTVTKTRAEKRRAILIDLAIGLGIPLLQIPLQYIVQGHRYNIFEDIGCLGETYETPVAVVLFHLPPILIGAVSAVYCILSIRSFYHSRSQFKELLSANKNLNLNRYVRLMALASTDLLLTMLMGIWVLWVNVRVVGLSPWISWDDTHSNFSRVVQVPGIYWRADPYSAASVETLRWATVACALLFFAFFGFADEAIKNYRGAFQSVAKRMGYSTAGHRGSARLGAATSKFPISSSSSRGATLPVFIRKDTTQKRDSFDSFSDMSASYGGISPLEYDADKARVLGEGEYDPEKAHGLTLGDVSRMLPDYKESDYSSSAPSSDTESVHGSDAEEIEVSSLHRASVHITLSPPEPAHVRRASASVDVPMPVVDAADIV